MRSQMGGIQDETTQRIKTQAPMQPRCECGGGGEGTLIFQFVRRLGPFFFFFFFLGGGGGSNF